MLYHLNNSWVDILTPIISILYRNNLLIQEEFNITRGNFTHSTTIIYSQFSVYTNVALFIIKIVVLFKGFIQLTKASSTLKVILKNFSLPHIQYEFKRSSWSYTSCYLWLKRRRWFYVTTLPRCVRKWLMYLFYDNMITSDKKEERQTDRFFL